MLAGQRSRQGHSITLTAAVVAVALSPKCGCGPTGWTHPGHGGGQNPFFQVSDHLWFQSQRCLQLNGRRPLRELASKAAVISGTSVLSCSGQGNKNSRSNRGLSMTTETRSRPRSLISTPTAAPSELSLLFLLLLDLSAEPQLPKSCRRLRQAGSHLVSCLLTVHS